MKKLGRSEYRQGERQATLASRVAETEGKGQMMPQWWLTRKQNKHQRRSAAWGRESRVLIQVRFAALVVVVVGVVRCRQLH